MVKRFAASLLVPLSVYSGVRVLVGVSGGADSVALLRALVEVGASPVVAHLDHALRPDSAQDARWVAGLCTHLNVPCEVVRVEVGTVAARRGWNLEDAARRVRYEVLGRVARQHGAAVILTAHTRRDQAETVLMDLLRGEPVLRGMPGERGRVRRPWLGVARADIEAFLRELGQDWREDPSNADPAHTRAWIRQELMPLLTARVPAIEEGLVRVARLQAQDHELLERLSASVTDHAAPERVALPLLRRRVRQGLLEAGLTFHGPHLEVLAAALAGGQTTHLTLPGGREVTVTGGRLHLRPHPWASPPSLPLPDGWTVRTRQSGDRLKLPGGTRKLSDVLTDAHVPRAERDRVPLLASAQGVQWVGLQPPFGSPLWAVGAAEALGVSPDPAPWHAAMGEALELARQAAALGEVPVGAVVLHEGQVVGRGRNTSRAVGDMTSHAEVDALREAARTLGTPYLTDCTLLVTLEPCLMCLGAALEARIGRIVYGAGNPKAGALGGVMDLLAAHWGHRPQIVSGVRAAEARRLLRETFQALRPPKGRLDGAAEDGPRS